MACGVWLTSSAGVFIFVFNQCSSRGKGPPTNSADVRSFLRVHILMTDKVTLADEASLTHRAHKGPFASVHSDVGLQVGFAVQDFLA